jgi:hypothetical protein
MVFEPTFEEVDADAAARDAALSNSVDPEAVVDAMHAIDPEAPADTAGAVSDDDLDADLEGEADAALATEVSADDLPAYGEE